MPLKFVCPKCKTALQVSSKMAGKTGQCKCGHQFKVPMPSAKTAPSSTTAASTGAAATSNNSAMWDELTDSDFARRSPFDKVVAASSDKEDMETLQRFTQDEVEQKQKQAGATRGVLKILSILSLLIAIFFFAIVGFFVGSPATNEKLVSYIPMVALDQGLGIALFVTLGLLMVVAAVGVYLQAFWGWIALAAFSIFLVVERGGVIGLVFQNGFEQMAFFAAMGPMLGALFLALFVFKGDTQEVCKIKNMIPTIIAVVLGLALGGAAVGAVFAQTNAA